MAKSEAFGSSAHESFFDEDALRRAFGYHKGKSPFDTTPDYRTMARTVLQADPLQQSVLVTKLCKRLNMDIADVLDKIRRLAV